MKMKVAIVLEVLLVTAVLEAVAAISFPSVQSELEVEVEVKDDGPPKFNGENWAVLVAGSRGFMNYRHQADICHAYHLLRRNGFEKDNIIMLSYDDVAESRDNPFPGKLYNYPTEAGSPGYNVYRGCKAAVTYRGPDANAQNFLGVLTQNSTMTGGKPVLQSTKMDRVFIYFADHGAPGLIAMPVGSPVYAQDLSDALKTMHKNDYYDQLVFYLEACESGSMFVGDLLPADMNIYATTAANGAESSWGTYCGFDAKVNGTLIGSCLGDLYSVMWMEDSDDVGRFHWESLDAQYTYVKGKTTMSHVTKFGDGHMGAEAVDIFLGVEGFPGLTNSRPGVAGCGGGNADTSNDSGVAHGSEGGDEEEEDVNDVAAYFSPNRAKATISTTTSTSASPSTSWDSRDIELLTLSHNYAVEMCPVKRKVLAKRLSEHVTHLQQQEERFTALYEKARLLFDTVYENSDTEQGEDEDATEEEEEEEEEEESLRMKLSSSTKENKLQNKKKELYDITAPLAFHSNGHLACHKAANEAVIHFCGMYSDSSLRYVRTIGHICWLGIESGIIPHEQWVANVIHIIQQMCVSDDGGSGSDDDGVGKSEEEAAVLLL